MRHIKQHSKITFFLLLLLTQSLFSAALSNMIKEKKWDLLQKMMTQEHLSDLKNKFSQYQKLKLIPLRVGVIKYYIKKKNRGEIGFIEYKREKHRFSELKLRENFTDLRFINLFEKISIKNVAIQISDATLTFLSGDLFIAKPLNRLVIFRGSMSLDILPNDLEEQRTLIQLYKKKAFTLKRKDVMMVLTDKVLADLLESKAKTANAPTILEKQYIKEQLTILQENYGIDIKPFKETWYPSFSGNLNIVFLIRNNHYFRLSYNPNNSPDTLLLDRKSNKYILSYNFQKGMKFSFSTENNVRKVQLNMYLNPYKLKVWSSALLLYPEATDMKSFQLAESLKLNDYFRGDDQNIDYIRQGENFFIIGKQFNRFTFRYSGNIPNQNQGLGDLKTKLDDRFGELDEYVILDNANRFYPNPGDQFFQSTLKISIPEELNCLASGFLHKKRKFFNRYEYLFKSEGTKGLTIVCGNFKPLTTIKAKSPITIFGGEGLKMRNYLKKQELKEMVNFLLSKYKKREIESLNILLRRWKEPGGISYKGFVVFNILKHRRTDVTTTRLTESMYKYSPVYLTKDINRDNLIHELAHQWWGGIISWKSYRDIWITEGGAQFSTLLYLENKLGKRLFNRIKRRIIKNIKRDSESGPLIYGTRIDNITKDYFAFQSIIYNKGAMVFMMLRDMLGEKGLLRRVNRIFTKFDKKSLTTKQFIRAFCKEKKGKAYLEKFFTNWIYFREIPQVSYSVHIADKLATIKVDQKNTDFVFPLKILVKMKGEDAEDVLIVTEKSQTFAIKKKTRIKRIRVDAGFSPIDLKEKRDG